MGVVRGLLRRSAVDLQQASLMGRLPSDPPWYEKTVDCEWLPPVNVVLVQGG